MIKDISDTERAEQHCGAQRQNYISENSFQMKWTCRLHYFCVCVYRIRSNLKEPWPPKWASLRSSTHRKLRGERIMGFTPFLCLLSYFIIFKNKNTPKREEQHLTNFSWWNASAVLWRSQYWLLTSTHVMFYWTTFTSIGIIISVQHIAPLLIL